MSWLFLSAVGRCRAQPDGVPVFVACDKLIRGTLSSQAVLFYLTISIMEMVKQNKIGAEIKEDFT